MIGCSAFVTAMGLLAAGCSGGDATVVNPTSDVGIVLGDLGPAVTDAATPGTDTAPTADASSVDAQPIVDATPTMDTGTTVTDAPTTTDAAAMDAGPSSNCRTNADCATGSFCFATTCDAPGVCIVRPDACGAVYNPVCGCNARTYGNTCEAASAGVRAAASGACVADAGAPTDIAQMDTGLSVCATIRCTATSRCCDVPGAPSYGSCYPTTCTTCCVAPADAGLVDAARADVPAGRCLTGADCSRTQFCGGITFPSSFACVVLGTCQTRPVSCPPLVSPVCTCEGVTYNSACLAQLAGARVATNGACAATLDGGRSACGMISCAPGTVCCETAGSPSYGRCYSSLCLGCCR